MDTALEVRNLVKNYGSFRAVNDISFSVEKGKITGFLGPNGAGKTTTIQILSGITLQNGGSIFYFGEDFSKHREACLQRINATSAFNTLMGRISVWENLLVFAELYQVQNPRRKIASLLDALEITELESVLYKDLSSGQKTRVNIVKSLLNDPELLLMDEPTASLDPDIADKTLTLIESLKKERGLAILYTSHNMNEITRICDDVVFLDRGKIVAQDTPRNLIKRISATTLEVTFDSRTAGLDAFLRDKSLHVSNTGANTIAIKSIETEIPGILFDLSKTGIWITDIDIKKPTLEDVFLQIARKNTL